MENQNIWDNAPNAPITQNDANIIIEGQKYSYSITKSEDKEDSLIIKVFDKDGKSEIYFTYEAHLNKLIKDIKYLSLCETLDEMIDTLKEIFSQHKVKVELDEDEYNLEMELNGIIKKKCIIQLTKHYIEKLKNPIDIKENKFTELGNKYKDLLNNFEQLKIMKENIIKKDEIKNILKELILDEDIKLLVFEGIEQIFLSKYNLNNIPVDKTENIKKNAINKIQNIIDNKTDKINK